MPKTPMPTIPAKPLTDYLGPGNTALVVSGLMLPVTGALVRAVTLWAAGVPLPYRLAVTAPVAELAVFGFFPVLLTGIVLLFAVSWARTTRPSTRSPIWFLPAVAALLGFVPMLLITGWIVALTTYALAVIAYYLARHTAANRPWRGPRIALALVLVYLVTGLAYGWVMQPPQPGAYRFTDPALDGIYVTVANDGDHVFLLDCAQRLGLLQVPLSAIASVTYDEAPAPGLWDSVRRTSTKPDLLYNCP